ncbi:MAG: DUF2891 domain-containing protein [Fidelibacterota bacterium]|nr:MAG: DUF2891 domain-containing protein [Candidatus Neomarinimicrobiota bacterium]
MIRCLKKCATILLVLTILWCGGESREAGKEQLAGDEPLATYALTQETASGFARLALKCVQQEYPNKLDHVMNDGGEVLPPTELHPSFYGCFDWHSAVHGHWMLVRLLKMFPDLPEGDEIRDALKANLSEANIQREVAYLQQKNRKSFERTYGWAWLLKLAEELQGWEDADGEAWSRNLAPLAEALVERYKDFLPRQTYPIRRGVHANTAFGIAFALDYTAKTSDRAFEELLLERSLAYFQGDEDCAADWEPGGDDFFSPCLMEADLMRRVLEPEDFQEWFERFLPGVVAGEQTNILDPAEVSDRSDPKIVHLDGLNLSRAWCMLGIAACYPEGDPVRAILCEAAGRHAEATLEHVASGQYEGEHWLASFAVYMLSM